MKKISPEKFLFEKYIGRVGYTINDVMTTRHTAKPGVKFLGFCEASRLPVRPRAEGFALMAEMENGDVVWLHVEQLPGITEKLSRRARYKKPAGPGTYTKEQFNKAYVDFRMDKMGSRKEMLDYDGIMRAYRGLIHVFINTEGLDEGDATFMQSLQVEFGMRMAYTHGADWLIKGL